MNNLSKIGLDNDISINLAEKLNNLLADYQVFYMNTRGFHWNIKGDKFFELHIKFEELYNDLQMKVDEIAERILTLGIAPLHSYTDYLKLSAIEPAVSVVSAKETVNSILASLKTLLIKEREILNISGEAGDEGTNALMSDYIREQEKLVWMYSTFLNE